MGYYNRNRKKYRRRAIKIFIALSILVFIFSAVSSFMSSNISPIIKNMGEAKVRALAINEINNAVHIVINDTLQYQDYVNIERNNSGEIVLIQSNFVKINRLTRDLANMAEEYISTLDTQTIQLPIGAFTGSAVFAGFGPPIDVRLLPIGSVLCNFVSTFESSGINQTIHRLYIDIATTICIVFPLEEVPLEVNMMVLVVENVIVGQVPETYIDTTTSQIDALNFLP